MEQPTRQVNYFNEVF